MQAFQTGATATRASTPFILAGLLLVSLTPSRAASASPQGFSPRASIFAADTGVRDSTALHPAPMAQLAVERPADGRSEFTMSVLQTGERVAKPLGTMSVEQTTLGSADSRLVRRVILYDYGTSGSVVDTTFEIAETLAPISERTYKPSGAIRLDFTGSRVTGAMGKTAEPRPVDDPLPTPAFNSTDLELVLRSLELREGLRDSLPIYDPEMGGYRWATVNVDGFASIATSGGERSAWRIHVRDVQTEHMYYVDRSTRALLAVDARAPKRGARYLIKRTDVTADLATIGSSTR